MVDVKDLDRTYNVERPDGGLAVFMPCVHGGRTAGVAASLRFSGNRIIVSGPSSTARIPFEQRYEANEAKARFGSNVSVYEHDDIFKNPPDVIVVGREDNEQASLDLWRRLSKTKPIVLCAYSGVFQARYNWSQYRGLICCDLPSQIVARYYDVPSLKFRPVFAIDDYPYQPYAAGEQFAFRSFINGLAWRFPGANKLHQKCKAALEATFPSKVLVENIEKVPLSEVKRLISVSAATLHIKDEEGFGWSLLESLASGRPIIAQAGLAKNMAFNDWVIPGETGFFFKETDDLVSVVRTLIDDPERLHRAQKLAADHMRQSFKPDHYAHELGNFLQDLWKSECARWVPGKPAPSERRAILHYQPSTDPDAKQDYELAIDEASATAKRPDDAPAGFTYKGKALHPEDYGSDYIPLFRSVIDRFLKIKTGNVLEWGSGHTTREMVNALNRRAGAKLFLTIDENKPYLDAVTADLNRFPFLRSVHLTLTGDMKGQDDPGPNYSSYPLIIGEPFDFIFIDGRRRVECAYSAAILSHSETIVVMHDYRRDRYQSALALFDVIEDGKEFRIMKIKKTALMAFDGELTKTARKFRVTQGVSRGL